MANEITKPSITASRTMAGGKLAKVNLTYERHFDAMGRACIPIGITFNTAAELAEYIPQLEYVLNELRRAQETFEEESDT